MKNKELTIVQNPMGSYRLSHIATYVTAFILLAVGITLTGIPVFCSEGIDIPDIVLIAALGVFPILWGISFIFRDLRIKKIMRYGDKVEGKIVSYTRFHYIRKHGISSRAEPRSVILNVRFNYKGDHCLGVYIGHTLPNKTFATEKCSVYIYNNRVFVTGFVKRHEWDPEIDIPESENSIRYR